MIAIVIIVIVIVFIQYRQSNSQIGALVACVHVCFRPHKCLYTLRIIVRSGEMHCNPSVPDYARHHNKLFKRA